MQQDELRDLFESVETGQNWLAEKGLARPEVGYACFTRLAELGLPPELLANLVAQLALQLPRQSDPDRALSNFERYLRLSRSPLSTGALIERDHAALPTMLTIFSASQYLSDLLIADPESFDLLRLSEGGPVARESLVAEIESDVRLVADDPRAVMNSLRFFKRREILRIAYGDLVMGQPLDIVSRQIAILCDAILAGAVIAAWSQLTKTRPAPAHSAGSTGQFVVLGLGKLGGNELNYSSDIDLMFLYDVGRVTSDEQDSATRDFFERLARLIIKLITEPTELGVAYTVNVVGATDEQSRPFVRSVSAALRYYDFSGRTWERQIFVKARPVAGARSLGEEFLQRLTPWIYRRYLSRADITGIRALKRRIENRAIHDEENVQDVKLGRGGIGDIENVIQFLQLLNGGDLLEVRTTNTLSAIRQLQETGCLTSQERSLLEENYAVLRTVENRMQIMYDLQTHRLPLDPTEGRTLARRLGYTDTLQRDAWESFLADYKQRTQLNRGILERLLRDAFDEDETASREGDLLLDPTPTGDQIRAVLRKYHFTDVEQAYRILAGLGREKIRFLSTRRCRHFLSAIAPQLLAAIAATADPDFTLANLATVSDSLGGKGVLWELFRFHPPSLKLYVDLCSSSETLSSLLCANPGMIDELLDSLMLDKLPTLEGLRGNVSELCRGASDWETILQRFKNGQILRLGVRDILAKNSVEAISGTLADIAQVIVEQTVARQFDMLVARLGRPMVQNENAPLRPCPYALVALGKFGGRELNYYSGLDFLLVYEADGMTMTGSKGTSQGTSNHHFFTELGQRVIKTITALGPYGRLYSMDPQQRPGGQGGQMAVAFIELAASFSSGQYSLGQRQALCKARVIHAEASFSQRVVAAVHAVTFGLNWSDEDAQAILEQLYGTHDAEPHDLKNGPGGLTDVERFVQALQLRYGNGDPSVRLPGTIAALEVLRHAGHVPHDQADRLLQNYRFLRRIQARRRLMSSVAQDTLPRDSRELSRLSSLLGYSSANAFQQDTARCLAENRQLLGQIFPLPTPEQL